MKKLTGGFDNLFNFKDSWKIIFKLTLEGFTMTQMCKLFKTVLIVILLY